MTVENDGGYLIFGATGGVGSALAHRLRKTGAKVLIAGRNSQKLDKLSESLDAPSIEIDINVSSSIEDAFSEAKSKFGKILGVANCIGTVHLKPLHMTSSEEFYDVINTNLGSSFQIMKSGVAAMKKDGGAMVFFSTAATRIGMPNHEAIASAKSAIEGLVLSAAASYASRSLRFNVIAPGLVKTDMTRSIWENEINAKVSQGLHALGRFGDPEEIASVAEFLLSPENSWITGQILGVDGGLGNVMSRRKA